MILRELFLRLGLDLDGAAFAQGMLTVNALQAAVTGIATAAFNAGKGLIQQAIGVNATAEATKMQLSTIIAMNLKKPWEEAKVASEELFEGLREDAAKTPSDTQELVNFAQEISNAYLGAGKSVQDLRKFTTGAVVAAKTLNLQGTAALDIQQAISGTLGVRDRFGIAMIKQMGLTKEQFNAKTMQERVGILEKAFTSPAIMAAMKDFETNWQGVTSTLEDNFQLMIGAIGKPAFDMLKEFLLLLGTWVQKNKDSILKFFTGLWKAFAILFNVVKAGVHLIYLLITGFLRLNTITQAVILGLGALTTAMIVLGGASVGAALRAAAAWALAALPIVLITTLAAFLILLIEDIYVGLTGGKSVVFDLFNAWSGFLDEWAKPKGDDPWWLTALRAFLNMLLNSEEVWNTTVEMWSGIINGWIESIKQAFRDLWSWVKDTASSALDAINPFSGQDSTGSLTRGFIDQVPNRSLGDAITTMVPQRPSVTISPKVDLHLTTSGEPDDVGNVVRRTFEDLSQVWLREASEGVK